MRSQPNCFEVVVVVDVVFVAVVVLNVDVVVQATSKVDLRLLVMEVEFGWGGWGGVGGVQTHFRVKPNSVEVVLRLGWGCDKMLDNLMKKTGCDTRTPSATTTTTTISVGNDDEKEEITGKTREKKVQEQKTALQKTTDVVRPKNTNYTYNSIIKL